ncbi:MAG: preQ(1) synthase [Chloroflexota bacterium]|nr:preQ(1) synthase [Chloroflexota bacterium]
MAVNPDQFRALGKAVRAFGGLDAFPCPAGVQEVTLTSDEVTALCPVTGQPDWYTVSIAYVPRERCIESKSLKLYLQSFREEGIFAEAFAARIANDVAAALAPATCQVTVTQKARGGITIEATAVVDAAE